MTRFGSSGPLNWLQRMTDDQPLIVWKLASERIGPPIDVRAFVINRVNDFVTLLCATAAYKNRRKHERGHNFF
jgi:hypothetical protein